MPALEELAAAWRAQPGPEQTIALCAELRGSGSEALAAEVVRRALADHAGEVSVLLAVGCLQARRGWLAQAQTTLALAGKRGGRDPRPFAALGRVLLLRGDARRSLQALQRTLELGCADAGLAPWLDAASELEGLQQREGSAAVQVAVAARGLAWVEPATAPQAAPVRVIAWGEATVGAEEGRRGVAAGELAGTIAAVPAFDGRCPPPVGGSGADSAEAEATWAPARRGDEPGARALLVAALASALVLTGGYLFAARVQARRTAFARAGAEVVRAQLRSRRAAEAGAGAPELRRLFELDGRHPDVIAAFLEERVVGSLWQAGPPVGLSEAVTRARAAGLPAPRVIAGRVAERLAAGDVAGARALVEEHDGTCLDDALYALASGAALERAGDARAVSRYRLATELAPDSLPARVLLARLGLLEGELTTARRAVARLAADRGDEPVSRTLSRLAWAVDPGRGEAPAPQRLTDDEHARLPPPLRSAPNLVEAVLALDRGDRARAAELIGEGLALAVDPAEVTAFGMVAVRAGQEPLARRAAWRVHRAAPEYPGLPALAARVALLRGRFADATLAVTTGAPARELALVLAVDAYERLDGAGVRAALAALPGLPARDPEAAALAVAPTALDGSGLPELDTLHDLVSPSDLWGDVLGVDLALDAGRVDLARALARAWPAHTEEQPPRAVRLARLARITGKPEAAVEHAARAVAAGDATPRAVVELVRALVEVGDASTARSSLRDHRAGVGPVLGDWLDVLVTRAESGGAGATVRAARCPLPPPDAPLLVQALAVRALAEAGDLRAAAATAALARRHPAHPDVVAAAALLRED